WRRSSPTLTCAGTAALSAKSTGPTERHSSPISMLLSCSGACRPGPLTVAASQRRRGKMPGRSSPIRSDSIPRRRWRRACPCPTATFSSPTPPFSSIDATENRLSVRGPLSERDWGRLFDVLRDYRIARLDAGGISDRALKLLSRHQHLTHLQIEGAGPTDEG